MQAHRGFEREGETKGKKMFILIFCNLCLLWFHLQNKCITENISRHTNQGILEGEVSLYRWSPVWLVWISLFCNKNKNCQLSYSWFQTSQTGGEWYSDTSPFSIPYTDTDTHTHTQHIFIYIYKHIHFSFFLSLSLSLSPYIHVYRDRDK